MTEQWHLVGHMPEKCLFQVFLVTSGQTFCTIVYELKIYINFYDSFLNIKHKTPHTFLSITHKSMEAI